MSDKPAPKLKAPPPPALFKHMQTLYSAMERKTQAAEDPDGGGQIQVYEGKILETFLESVGEGQRSKYSPILKGLRDMGCVERIQRGYQGTPSRYIMVGPPTLEKFDMYVDTPARLRERVPWRTLIERVQALEIKIEALEDRLTEQEDLILRLGGRQLHDEEESTDGRNHGSPEGSPDPGSVGPEGRDGSEREQW